MQFAVHKSKERNFLHIIFAHKNGVDGVEAHGGDIQVRKVIGAEDILLAFVERSLAYYAIGEKGKNEKTLCPPAVDDAYQVKMFGKNDGDEKQRKQDDEEQ